MGFPVHRPRRLRRSELIRALVRETDLSPGDLIIPLFVCPGKRVRREIPSMPGQYNLSVDEAVAEAQEARSLGVPAVLLFGIPEAKDARASGAYDAHGTVQEAASAIKKEVHNILVITDVCLCEYTDHGHCGVVQGEEILNDPTLDLLAKTAVSQARAGADIVAPSDMMDGRVAAIRKALDARGSIRCRSCRTPRNTPRASTVRSARRRSRPRSSATAAATRWTRPTRARRLGKRSSTSRRAPTS